MTSEPSITAQRRCTPAHLIPPAAARDTIFHFLQRTSIDIVGIILYFLQFQTPPLKIQSKSSSRRIVKLQLCSALSCSKIVTVMDSNTKTRPKLVKLEKAFKLAEMWVNGLSGPPLGGDQNDLQFIGRPERLGLGAKITPNVRTSSANPVERKIHGVLKAIKEKSSESFEKANSAEQNRPEENDDDDDEPESRIKALTKRKAQPTVTPRQPTKRLK